MKLPKNEIPTNFISNAMTARDSRGSSQLPIDDYKKYKEYTEGKLIGSEVASKGWFKMGCVVGKGGFGKVWRVEMKRGGKVYAMKEMYKTKIIEKKSINSIMNERNLLSRMKHPFLVNMSYAFQDRENIYLVMDYLNGGDLRYHIGKRRKFS